MKFNYKVIPVGGLKLPKILLAMKLTIIMMVATLSAVSANTYSQMVTLREKNISIVNVLNLIEKQTNYHFLFDKRDISKAGSITVNIENVTVEQALNKCLKDQPLTYKIFENTIVIKGLNNLNTELSPPKDIIIKGTVSDSRGLTLPGVSIKIKGSMVGVSTDIDGKYSISVPNANAILVFSSIGFNSQEITVGDRSSVDVKMTEELTSLTEVVVTALGIKKEAKRLGYATATVNAQQISENRTVNFMSGLVGKMPGVNITPMGTGPAGSSKIRIRGQSSFGAQNSPLIVVNGVPINNTTFGVNGDFGGQGAVVSTDGGDGLSSINPDDIESMTVLKGGAAAALYGSRAQNGVVMITTKSGNSNKGLGVDYNSNYTSDTPLDFTDLQYEYGQGEFGVRPTTPNPTSGVWSFGEKFQPGMTQVLYDGVTAPYEPVRDRIKKFYQVGSTLTNTVSVSNGGANGGFNLSLANMDNSSIQPNSKFNRRTINLGFNQKISQKLSVSGNIAYSSEKNTNPVVVGGQDNSTPVLILLIGFICKVVLVRIIFHVIVISMIRPEELQILLLLLVLLTDDIHKKYFVAAN